MKRPKPRSRNHSSRSGLLSKPFASSGRSVEAGAASAVGAAARATVTTKFARMRRLMARAAYTIVGFGGGGGVLGHHASARNRQVADRAAVYPSRLPARPLSERRARLAQRNRVADPVEDRLGRHDAHVGVVREGPVEEFGHSGP